MGLSSPDSVIGDLINDTSGSQYQPKGTTNLVQAENKNRSGLAGNLLPEENVLLNLTPELNNTAQNVLGDLFEILDETKNEAKA